MRTPVHSPKILFLLVFPGGLERKESACNAGDSSSILGQEDPLEKEMAIFPVLLTGEFQGQSQKMLGKNTPLRWIKLDQELKQVQHISRPHTLRSLMEKVVTNYINKPLYFLMVNSIVR